MPDQNQPKEETTHKMRNLGETLTPHKYKATYVRKGTQGKKPSSLLICIRDENDHELCDHLWVRHTKSMDRLNSGDLITFVATPIRYIKGYSGTNHVQSEFSTDITLSDIKKIRVLGNNPVIAKKTEDWNKTHADKTYKQEAKTKTK